MMNGRKRKVNGQRNQKEKRREKTKMKSKTKQREWKHEGNKK